MFNGVLPVTYFVLNCIAIVILIGVCFMILGFVIAFFVSFVKAFNKSRHE